MKKLILLLVLWMTLPAYANNLRLRNGAYNHNHFTVEIAWDNSWNYFSSGGSYDAIWMFLKAKNSDGSWVHLNISVNLGDHSVNTNDFTIEVPVDGKGLFLFRRELGTGNNPYVSIDISTILDINVFREVRVYAIEMVYIPQGSYYLGDGASISSFANTQNQPFLVSGEEEITNNQLKILNPNQEFQPAAIPAVLPATYPKGYNGFYCMKYEISQVQYADFLNTLTFKQQQARTSVSPNSTAGSFAMINPYLPDSLYRNSILIAMSGVENIQPAIYACNANRNILFNEGDDGLNRAMNFLSYADLSAYLDWAALRPITELEFEKVCRGANQYAIPGEFAWSSPSVTDADHPINDGTVFESVSDVVLSGNGLANHGNTITGGSWGLRGPLRTGFAASTNTDRLTSGSAYYGVMEMSGNVWEMVVQAGEGGEYFLNETGDGTIDENGYSNQVSWCNPLTAKGMMYRGGGWASTISGIGSWRDLAVSDRFYSHIKPSVRRNTSGGRGGR